MATNSLRTAYGEALVEQGKDNKNIVVLEADLGKSTMSCLFQAAYPERYFEMSIAEANMASTAAGLALTGKIPFINSFAVFSTGRCYDQLRQTISIAGLNVKICGSSAGLSDYGDGSTHQSIEDMGLMRGIPGMTVLVPVDAVETAQMVAAMVETRVSRFMTWVSSWAMTPSSSSRDRMRMMPVVAATAACCGLRPVAKALGLSEGIT